MGFFNLDELKSSDNNNNRDLENHLLDDEHLKKILKGKKNVLLIEPNYSRKYIPSGLGRISTYLKENNNAQITFARSHIKNKNFDLVCIASLFTYDSEIVIKTINRSQSIYKDTPIIIGGVFASLMPEHIVNAADTNNIRIFTGCSNFLDQYPIDYSIDWKLYGEWRNFSYIFTTRGCPNKCGFCAVWRMEATRKVLNWKSQVNIAQPNIMICDNNLSSWPLDHIKDVTDFIKKYELAAMFDGGFDCKYVTDDLARLFKGMKFCKSGMRTGFDRIEEDGTFQRAVETLKKYVSRASMLSYVLYNFNDAPKEADYRMRECNRLNVRPYPQRYVPLKTLNREEHYVGKHWTDNLAKAFRNFWITPRLFKHIYFEDYIKDRKIQAKFYLTEKDISFYEGGNDGNQTHGSGKPTRKRKKRINRKRNNPTE